VGSGKTWLFRQRRQKQSKISPGLNWAFPEAYISFSWQIALFHIQLRGTSQGDMNNLWMSPISNKSRCNLVT
jgi:hypothetical protein